jgi:NADPH:quinone reductase-like Zn-dependent oxidoreductase
MKAAQIKTYGDSEVVEINQSTSAPNDPSTGKVLLNVKAAGVNPADWKFRNGFFQQMMPLQFPSTLGWDFSGVIEKVGQAFLILTKVMKYMDRHQNQREALEHLQK